MGLSSIAALLALALLFGEVAHPSALNERGHVVFSLYDDLVRSGVFVQAEKGRPENDARALFFDAERIRGGASPALGHVYDREQKPRTDQKIILRKINSASKYDLLVRNDRQAWPFDLTIERLTLNSLPNRRGEYVPIGMEHGRGLADVLENRVKGQISLVARVSPQPDRSDLDSNPGSLGALGNKVLLQHGVSGGFSRVGSLYGGEISDPRLASLSRSVNLGVAKCAPRGNPEADSRDAQHESKKRDGIVPRPLPEGFAGKVFLYSGLIGGGIGCLLLWLTLPGGWNGSDDGAEDTDIEDEDQGRSAQGPPVEL